MPTLRDHMLFMHSIKNSEHGNSERLDGDAGNQAGCAEV